MTTEPVGKVKFLNPGGVTPLWVKSIYRVVFAITTALAVWVAATHLFSDESKFEIILVLKFFDPVVYSICQMFGIDTTITSDFYKGATSDKTA